MEYKDVYYTMGDFEDYGVDFTEYHSDSQCNINIDSSLIDNDVIDELILLVYDRFFEFYIYNPTDTEYVSSLSKVNSNCSLINKVSVGSSDIASVTVSSCGSSSSKEAL